MLVLLIALIVADASDPPCPLSKNETRMIVAINKYRAERRLPALKVDPILMQVARNRTGFVVKPPYYGHKCNGQFSWEAAQACGFHGICTDNLGQGDVSPEEMVGDHQRGWGDERPGHTVGHDKQMKGFYKLNGKWVDAHFDRVGVAHRGDKYIAIFGKRK